MTNQNRAVSISVFAQHAISAMGKILLLLCFNIFLVWSLSPSYATGASMAPTITSGSIQLMWRWATPKQGDIVVLAETSQHCELEKRLIATEGQTVSIQNGITYVDGQALGEDYVVYVDLLDNMSEITVPEGKCFVMGDNRLNSKDSRDYGCFDINEIKGVIIYSVPLKGGKV